MLINPSQCCCLLLVTQFHCHCYAQSMRASQQRCCCLTMHCLMALWKRQSGYHPSASVLLLLHCQGGCLLQNRHTLYHRSLTGAALLPAAWSPPQRSPLPRRTWWRGLLLRGPPRMRWHAGCSVLVCPHATPARQEDNPSSKRNLASQQRSDFNIDSKVVTLLST